MSVCICVRVRVSAVRCFVFIRLSITESTQFRVMCGAMVYFSLKSGHLVNIHMAHQ